MKKEILSTDAACFLENKTSSTLCNLSSNRTITFHIFSPPFPFNQPTSLQMTTIKESRFVGISSLKQALDSEFQRENFSIDTIKSILDSFQFTPQYDKKLFLAF